MVVAPEYNPVIRKDSHMLRATQMAAALAAAASKTPKTHNNWIARKVDHMLGDERSTVGIVKEPDIKVKARFKTRQTIAIACGVRV